MQYADDGATEVAMAGFICDAVRVDGSVIEVQTGSYAPLCKKVLYFAKQKVHVTIITPIIKKKFIELYDCDGQLLRKSVSPKKENLYQLFDYLVYAPELACQKNVTIVLCVVEVLEKRIDDGKGSYHRKGISISDTVMLQCCEAFPYKTKREFATFIPFKKNEIFTVSSFAKTARLKRELASKTLFTLNKMKVVERVGKNGNSFLYKKV
jgi:hypothetical protein